MITQWQEAAAAESPTGRQSESYASVHTTTSAFVGPPARWTCSAPSNSNKTIDILVSARLHLKLLRSLRLRHHRGGQRNRLIRREIVNWPPGKVPRSLKTAWPCAQRGPRDNVSKRRHNADRNGSALGVAAAAVAIETLWPQKCALPLLAAPAGVTSLEVSEDLARVAAGCMHPSAPADGAVYPNQRREWIQPATPSPIAADRAGACGRVARACSR